jgi:hypothetical protein
MELMALGLCYVARGTAPFFFYEGLMGKQDDDLIGTVCMDSDIALKLKEIQSQTSRNIDPVKRGNYAILLKKYPRERMERIVENLLLTSETDCRVGFAMLKYLIGDTTPAVTSPKASLEELRSLIDAKLIEVASQVPPESSEE